MLSKNFSFWTVSLDLDAMFKTKSLPYKDLVLNSRGCRKSNQLLRHPRTSMSAGGLFHTDLAFADARFCDKQLLNLLRHLLF